MLESRAYQNNIKYCESRAKASIVGVSALKRTGKMHLTRDGREVAAAAVAAVASNAVAK